MDSQQSSGLVMADFGTLLKQVNELFLKPLPEKEEEIQHLREALYKRDRDIESIRKDFQKEKQEWEARENELRNARIKSESELKYNTVVFKHKEQTESRCCERDNRFHSFAPPRTENDAKWFVDGCSYMWAVSVAIEEAKDSIWILDWWLTPELYLRRPPNAHEQYRLDRMLLAAAERGVKINIIIYKEVASILSLCSEHTKQALEIHPNIAVFRHPDHVLRGQVLETDIISKFKNLRFKFSDLTKSPQDILNALYDVNNDIILYWAHHEKLCLIDKKIAFMGGLDLCFGRWDTNSHPIADVHLTNVNRTVFPGQDYNNARIFDFKDVQKIDSNRLNRGESSRMGWSDLSICLQGPVIKDLGAHFVQRWNFIFNKKHVCVDDRYQLLEQNSTGLDENKGADIDPIVGQHHKGISVQLVRSCAGWSHGVSTENSISNAYIQVIHDSQYFVYIENQFFITATSDSQHPIRNKIGKAIVERIVRAYQNNETYKVIVCLPAIPAFAGDLRSHESLSTRAIMKFQYASICRGRYSIIKEIERAGVSDAKKYIQFYNLRNYDRINALDQREMDANATFERVSQAYDNIVGTGYDSGWEQTVVPGVQEQYEAANSKPADNEYHTVSHCYMDSGVSIQDVPWTGNPEAEIDAFVSEQLYIHSKVLIADDRVVICGSANLNDRSQLGYHDSEIAVVIEDPTPIDSFMNGQRFQASKFATSLRRQLFRKHLGLLPSQDWTKPDVNFMPIHKDPNSYDWGSPNDILVRDVLSSQFSNLWEGTAKSNTDIYAKAFHYVPADNVRNWKDYDSYFAKWFVNPDPKSGKFPFVKKGEAKYKYGHVVKEKFPGGVNELKESLSRVRGSLVEMPLLFMNEVDFAEEGVKLNFLTEGVYT